MEYAGAILAFLATCISIVGAVLGEKGRQRRKAVIIGCISFVVAVAAVGLSVAQIRTQATERMLRRTEAFEALGSTVWEMNELAFWVGRRALLLGEAEATKQLQQDLVRMGTRIDSWLEIGRESCRERV